MRNQPLSPDLSVGDASGDSLIDPPAAMRFRSLAIFFFVAACFVLVRISWVKANLQQRYLSALNQTTTEYELIPARDGRILSEAADVFATDVEQYSVQAHYRWLQEPVDDAWLQRQVRSRLSRTERSNAENVVRLKAELIQQRAEMWNRLADANGISEDEFAARREAVQERVSRIADSVNARRNQVAAHSPVDEAADSILLKLAAGIRSSLTTAPRREFERIIVREEESYHEIVSDVPLSTAGLLKEQSHLFPGVRVVAGSRRTYPLSSLAAHVVGARTAATEQDSQSQPQTFADGDWKPRPGRFGVERSYDHQLRSVPGLRRIVRNRRMEIVESEIERQPVAGRDVLLTLDVSLQKHAEQLLAEALLDRPVQLLANDEDDDKEQQPQPVPTGGCIVVMEVATGRVIAAASAPTFRLSLFTGASSADWEAVNQDQRHPFLFRATSMAIPPGSVMKPLSAVAAIESGGLNPDAPFYCQGYLRQPDEHRCLIFRLYSQGHNNITLSRAIAQSCNVYFFAAAQKMGFKPLRQWCDRFGLGRSTGIDLPAERSGNLPAGDRVENETLGLAIGQSSLTVTPLQITRAMAAIANGGWLVTPHVVSPDGTARTTTDIDDRPRELTRRRLTGLTEGTLDRVREGMRAVVEEPYGSGHKTVRLDDVAIAGKTGTAENGGGRPDHAWFAGYVPADQPQYAFAVVLENGGSGSRAAGPVARELVRKMVHAGLVNSRR